MGQIDFDLDQGTRRVECGLAIAVMPYEASETTVHAQRRVRNAAAAMPKRCRSTLSIARRGLGQSRGFPGLVQQIDTSCTDLDVAWRRWRSRAVRREQRKALQTQSVRRAWRSESTRSVRRGRCSKLDLRRDRQPLVDGRLRGGLGAAVGRTARRSSRSVVDAACRR